MLLYLQCGVLATPTVFLQFKDKFFFKLQALKNKLLTLLSIENWYYDA